MTKTNPELKIIKDEVLKCTKCPLHKTRKYPVIGQGDHEAKIMFIGEAPGFHEDQSGFPFRGQAGKVFDKLLQHIHLKREDIYIGNILKCRPPNNRNPKDEEIRACTPFLIRQLKIIQPQIICCLGNFATKFILDLFQLSSQKAGISQIHGKVFEVKNRKKTKIIPLYHPAVATYNPDTIETLKFDMQEVQKTLEQ